MKSLNNFLRKDLLLAILFLPLLLTGQETVTGIVFDIKTNEPLAFVNIVTDDGFGTITDIDGKFSIRSTEGNCCLNLSYVGYRKKRYTIVDGREESIYLSPESIDLSEVEIFPGDNPAHRIIHNVIEYRDFNNPEKIDAFTYTSYDKLILTVDADTLMKADTAILDSNQMEIRELLDRQHLFLIETVTERRYKSPGLNQENVIATKVSGFKDPMVAFMLSQIQSTSFYDEHIQIAGNDYINPISKGSTLKYIFIIEDTTYTERKDTVFIISYRPKLKTRFKGMKGFLYINSYKWAIQNVKAEPVDDSTGIRIKIQQGYELIEDHWFPVQLNTDIIFNMANASDGENNYPLIGTGRSYIKDINLNPDLSKRDFGYHEVEIDGRATKRSGEYWKGYRTDSLTAKELETYRIIDSIGKAENFDKMANSFQSVIMGQIPWKFINIDIDKFFHYNDYEGLYLGFGLHTNHVISNKFTIGGFWGYGFRDKSAKYGMDIEVDIHSRSESKLRIDAYNKVTASGGVEFFDEKYQAWRPDFFYKFFYNQMNTTIGGDINFSFRIKSMRDFKWNIRTTYQNKYPFENYYFSNPADTSLKIEEFHNTEVSIGFRFAFREKNLNTTKGRISLGSNYPVLWVSYSRGIKGIFDGQFEYNRFDLKMSYTKKFKYIGESSIQINAGFIDNPLPISNLYRGKGTGANFSIFAPTSFSTMGPHEFYSDRYFSVFLSHSFKDLLFSIGNFKPELMLLTNIGFGNISNTYLHHNIGFSSMKNGYYESGIVIRKLLNLRIYDLGAGVIYRYGPYGFETPADNFSYRISLYYAF